MNARLLPRMAGVAAAALLLAALFSQTALYARLDWWVQDAEQRLLGKDLPLDHVVVFDVDEESMQRLAPRLGAWPYSRDVYAEAMRFFSEHGARAVVFDILFSEARAGDDAFAAALDGRSVLSAAALPYPLDRGSAYLGQLRAAALFPTNSDPAAYAAARVWPDLTLPLAKFTAPGKARIGVMSAAADGDGVVRRLWPLHQAYGQILPSLPLAGLLAAQPDAALQVEGRSYRAGTRTWPAGADGALVLRYPRNAASLPVVPFFELERAAAGVGAAHLADAVRGRIVFVGSSSAVLGDFAFTPAGRLPGLFVNALVTEMLVENQVLRPASVWTRLLLFALALAIPIALAGRGAAARPREFLLGAPALAALVAGAGLGLFALNQQAGWLLALVCGLLAQAAALLAWLFALYRERQRLYYEKLAALEASRMKSEFLTHMTHELRTPITAIIGFNKVNQLTDNLGREQRVRNSEIISRNCDHLLALVNNNLDLARIEAGQLAIERKAEDVAALLEDVAATLRLMAEQKGLALELRVPAPLPPALAVDAFRVRQVLINLLGNAVKFTERGTVALEARWEPVPPPGELHLGVRDTGPGIPAASLPRLFEPFQRGVGARVVGTGLGLAITRKLVELMGGTIAARSTPGAGTTFEIRLPAAAAAAAAIVEPRVEAMPAPLAGRVLVAEDNEALRELADLHLRALGLQPQLVANGFEAVEAAASDPFDVVLMDMDMPLMDGYEAVKVLRERGYERPIVAFTAHSDGPEVERARALGCNLVLAKPVTLERLRGALAAYLPEGRAPAIPVSVDARIAELLPRFIESCRAHCIALQAAAASAAWADAAGIGHSLRGAGGGYGFHEITQLGKDIELAARAHDASALEAIAVRFEDYLERVEPVFE